MEQMPNPMYQKYCMANPNIHGNKSREFFDKLKEQQSAIEEAIGATLTSSSSSGGEKPGDMLGDHPSIFLKRKVTGIQQMHLAVG